jgi:hypothetical protein
MPKEYPDNKFDIVSNLNVTLTQLQYQPQPQQNPINKFKSSSTPNFDLNSNPNSTSQEEIFQLTLDYKNTIKVMVRVGVMIH